MLKKLIHLKEYPVDEPIFADRCRRALGKAGVVLLPNFITQETLESIKKEGLAQRYLAYYTTDTHNIYLTPPDSGYTASHPRNRQVTSSKGCITHDQIPYGSVLQSLYNDRTFKAFLASVLGEKELHPYADNLSSINLHYASEGQELGWHFDNSSFAITLLIEKPESGGRFEYVNDVRDADSGEMNYPLAEKVLDGNHSPEVLPMEPGTLVLFRGRNSMHRVTPTVGDRTRMLAVLAYNAEPEVSLSESARMTFFGRLN